MLLYLGETKKGPWVSCASHILHPRFESTRLTSKMVLDVLLLYWLLDILDLWWGLGWHIHMDKLDWDILGNAHYIGLLGHRDRNMDHFRGPSVVVVVGFVLVVI